MDRIKDLDDEYLKSLKVDKLPNLDDDGNDIMYQLYDMFMKKHNIPLTKYISREEEDSDNSLITFDFEKMPSRLKGLLYIFSDTHYNAKQVFSHDKNTL
jgi:hypothetical protein